MGLVFVSMFIMTIMTKMGKCGRIVPSSLIAIITGTLFEHLINRNYILINTRTVGETAAIDGAMPVGHLPQLPENGDWFTVLFYAI